MKLNSVERALVNNPLRAAHQHHRESAWFRRLAGGDLSGQHVLEVGCGRGVGSEVILDRLGAERVMAFDLDDSMVELARRRLHGRPVSLSVGDVCAIEQASGAIDTVVDFGIIHHVPGWQNRSARSLACCGRAVCCCSRKSPATCWTRGYSARSPSIRVKIGFETDEFAAELAHHGLHGTGRTEPHFGGALFVGAARKI